MEGSNRFDRTVDSGRWDGGGLFDEGSLSVFRVCSGSVEGLFGSVQGGNGLWLVLLVCWLAGLLNEYR